MKQSYCLLKCMHFAYNTVRCNKPYKNPLKNVPLSQQLAMIEFIALCKN